MQYHVFVGFHLSTTIDAIREEKSIFVFWNVAMVSNSTTQNLPLSYLIVSVVVSCNEICSVFCCWTKVDEEWMRKGGKGCHCFRLFISWKYLPFCWCYVFVLCVTMIVRNNKKMDRKHFLCKFFVSCSCVIRFHSRLSILCVIWSINQKSLNCKISTKFLLKSLLRRWNLKIHS